MRRGTAPAVRDHVAGLPGRHRYLRRSRSSAWLTGYRRRTIRYERHNKHFAGFLQLAAAPTYWKTPQ
ncbi:hypothetical protein BKE56_003915 [Rhodococcus sp. M8]|nr:hypothetical protein BKE56_003915 [Rhodococcus sp. M8]